jgi:dihydroorotate dehydrogenase electron transfer subunit
MLENCKILENECIGESYNRVVFSAPGICPKVKPGQFVHVQISNLRDRILRRPFSICDANKKGELTVIYKVVGEGTAVLATLPAGTECSIMGPQGIPFSIPEKNEVPIIVAGGYGSAATYILAKNSPVPGKILMGARTSSDLILIDEFKKTGFEVLLATEDGSTGEKGYVTKLLDGIIKNPPSKNLRFYGCGPHGMLMALGKMLLQNGLDGELSLDHLMCCGIGACYACVVKVKDETRNDGWRYARTCKEGPVFNAKIIYYD